MSKQEIYKRLILKVKFSTQRKETLFVMSSFTSQIGANEYLQVVECAEKDQATSIYVTKHSAVGQVGLISILCLAYTHNSRAFNWSLPRF